MSAALSMVEIRSYRLKPGTRAHFHALVHSQVLPLLRAWPMDVVHMGPSQHDEDSYVLIRAYTDLTTRQQQQDGFYSSLPWIDGPRAQVLSMIQDFISVVLPLDAAALHSLRNTETPHA